MAKLSNFEVEMLWVAAWNELLELVGNRREVMCQLPDWRVVTVEECQGWLQDSVYEGYSVEITSGWVRGKPGVVVQRWPRESEPPAKALKAARRRG